MHILCDFSPIGSISSCYKEKFGIPRQPGLVKAAKSQLILNDIFSAESIRGLEGFSHIWLQFIFHKTCQQGWKQMIKPPRLGGNKKVGVFASRSMFRPNSIGLSVVEIDKIEIKQSTITLHLLGCDLLDGTPVLDIKPYLPYVDSIPNAHSSFATDKPLTIAEVSFSEESLRQCKQASRRLDEDIENLVKQILQLDPRPAYRQKELNNERVYSMKLHDFDLKWQYCENNKIKVLAVNQVQ